MPHPLILASSSPRRLDLLASIGVKPAQVVAADIDETPRPGELPRALAQRLATEKLAAVKARVGGGHYILAADTVVAVGRRILPKAETADDIRLCLRLVSGRRHHVYTGIALGTPDGKTVTRLSDSTVIFRQLSEHDIDAYATHGESIGNAGGYAIQGRAAALIRQIGGSPSGIIGLPLFETAQLLRGTGFTW